MTAKLLCKAAYIPLLMATFIFGCKKKNDGLSSSTSDTAQTNVADSGTLAANIEGTAFSSTKLISVDDTGLGRFQVYGTMAINGDTTVLAVYFPDTVSAIGSVINLDGQFSTIQYFNYLAQSLFSQASTNASGSVIILGMNKTLHQISGNFSGMLYGDGFETNITAFITTGSFTTTYEIQ